MITCPVCEHLQSTGGECEVCGKPLGPVAGVLDAGVAPLEGLETTGAAPVDVAEVPLTELEATLHHAVHVSTEPVPDVEPTAAAPVDVDAPLTPDLERTEQAGLPSDGPTVLPVAIACRYCRTPALPGERICSRCGMRLPVVAEAAGAPAPEAPRRTCGCGMVVPEAASCPACGARLA